MIRVVDEIYGSHLITEPVLIELILSKPVQRLKHINQAGAIKYTTPHATVNRYQHSIGVLILLQKLQASLTEQIAGLLHDIPHTAFSHVVDYALHTPGHDFHEQHHTRIINESNIPEILNKHNISLQEVLDETRHTLLEQDAPKLCADRIDYTLRDTQVIRKKDMSYYTKYLTTHNQEIVFTNQEVAISFAHEYLESDKHIWANPRESAAYELLAGALRQALNKEIISKQELWLTDNQLYNKLQSTSDEVIQENLSLLNKDLQVTLSETGTYTIKPKFRYINPKVKTPEGIKLATQLDKQLSQAIQEHKKWHEGGHRFDITSKAHILLKSHSEQSRI